MTSPELNDTMNDTMNDTGNAGYGSAARSTGREGVGSDDGTVAGQTDDVSFARGLGVDQTSDTVEKVKDAAQRGMANAQDAMSQLQAKASELTSNLIDKVNVDELTQKLEEQVRDHPTRTLLMAAGAGFLLGRVAKK